MPTISFYCVLCGTALQASSERPADLMECHSCSRHVPVPQLLSFPGCATNHLPVFPPEVLGLAVEFQCAQCQSRLHADARLEGRWALCPDCGAGTVIPRWLAGPRWPRPQGRDETAPRPPIDAEAATLSNAEIDFLSGLASKSPGATV